MPKISVIMPVYNAQAFLHEAIDSILQQTFQDFEFLIFNDGSTDQSGKIIASYNDKRIRFFDSSENRGYVKLLNNGLEIATGKYIARMDADDVSDRNRLERQFRFMEQNPGYVLCGSNYQVLGKGNPSSLPESDEEIRLRMLYITPFCHPAVMLRADVLRAHGIRYSEDHMPAEDHELWVKLSEYGKLYNLQERLLFYRLHDNNISQRPRTAQQIENLYNAQCSYIRIFFSSVNPDAGDVHKLHTFFFRVSAFTAAELFEVGDYIQAVVSGNHTYPVRSEMVHALLSHRYYYICTTSTGIGLKAFILANKFSFCRVNVISNMKLLMKSLLKYQRQ